MVSHAWARRESKCNWPSHTWEGPCLKPASQTQTYPMGLSSQRPWPQMLGSMLHSSTRWERPLSPGPREGPRGARGPAPQPVPVPPGPLPPGPLPPG